MIETEQGIWIEKGNKITLTNVRMWYPKGINPLAFLEFVGAEIRPSASRRNCISTEVQNCCQRRHRDGRGRKNL